MVLAAASSALAFAGPLHVDSVAALASDLIIAHTQNLATALPPLQPPTVPGSAPAAALGEAASASNVAAAAAAAEADLASPIVVAGTVEETRASLALVRAVHGMCDRVAQAEATFVELVNASAASCQAAPLQIAAQRE